MKASIALLLTTLAFLFTGSAQALTCSANATEVIKQMEAQAMPSRTNEEVLKYNISVIRELTLMANANAYDKESVGRLDQTISILGNLRAFIIDRWSCGIDQSQVVYLKLSDAKVIFVRLNIANAEAMRRLSEEFQKSRSGKAY